VDIALRDHRTPRRFTGLDRLEIKNHTSKNGDGGKKYTGHRQPPCSTLVITPGSLSVFAAAERE
jgi:hypothetical protein